MPDGLNGVGLVEYSADGTSWTSIMEYVGAVRVAGGELQDGEFHVFGLEYPVVTIGKFSAYQITMRMLYTDTAADPFRTLRGRYAAKSKTYFRWAYTKAESPAMTHLYEVYGYITSFPVPEADGQSADPIGADLLVRADTITEEDVALT